MSELSPIICPATTRISGLNTLRREMQKRMRKQPRRRRRGRTARWKILRWDSLICDQKPAKSLFKTRWFSWILNLSNLFSLRCFPMLLRLQATGRKMILDPWLPTRGLLRRWSWIFNLCLWWPTRGSLSIKGKYIRMSLSGLRGLGKQWSFFANFSYLFSNIPYSKTFLIVKHSL